MKKTIIGILLAVFIAVAVLPFAVSASGKSGGEKYGIKIGYGSGETVITDDNKDDVLCDGGSVKYSYDKSAKKGTLTLNNATLVSDNVLPINAEETDTLEIVLVGENKVISDSDVCIVAIDLIFSGTGSIDITSGDYTFGTPAIDCYGGITVNGGNIRVCGKSYAVWAEAPVTVNGGTLTLIATDSNDVNAAAISGLSDPEIVLGSGEVMFTSMFSDGSGILPTVAGDRVSISRAMYVLIAPEHSHCVCGGKNDEDGHNHEDMRWMPWVATDSLPTIAGNYYLVGDVVLSSEQKPTADVNICFNGKTVSVKKHSLDYDGYMICVDSETPVSVTLTDCIGSGTFDATDTGEFADFSSSNAATVCKNNKLVIRGAITVKGEICARGSGELRFSDSVAVIDIGEVFPGVYAYESAKLFAEGNTTFGDIWAYEESSTQIGGRVKVNDQATVYGEAVLVVCDNAYIKDIFWGDFRGNSSVSLLGNSKVTDVSIAVRGEGNTASRFTMSDNAEISGELSISSGEKNSKERKIIFCGDHITVGGDMWFFALYSGKSFIIEAENAVSVGGNIDMPDMIMNGKFVCAGEIKSGIFDADGEVVNNGKITGGIFYGTVSGNGTIEESAKVSIIFDHGDGKTDDVQRVLRGQKGLLPGCPVNIGYAFGGWKLNGELFDFGTTPVIDDITLTATWTLCDHSGSTEIPTCTEGAACTVCSENLPAVGHSPEEGWKHDENSHWKSCKNCTDKLDETAHSGGIADCKNKAVCDICGAAYGDYEANRHTGLVNVPAKPATDKAEGNTEYWYCEGCGKYYSDSDGVNEITKADTVIPVVPKTGDTSAVMLLVALLSVGGILSVGRRKKNYIK